MKKSMLEFFIKINDLQKTKRYFNYEKFIESTSDHSYKLILMIDYLFDELNLQLDYHKCIKLAIYHDIGEIDLDYDIDAYASSIKENKTAKDKEEYAKIDSLANEYDLNIIKYFSEYKEKITEESKFVNACDKLEACIHVLSVKEEIMNREFFANYSDSLIILFPKLLPIYKQIKLLMKERYLELGYEWKDEYENIFNSEV